METLLKSVPTQVPIALFGYGSVSMQVYYSTLLAEMSRGVGKRANTSFTPAPAPHPLPLLEKSRRTSCGISYATRTTGTIPTSTGEVNYARQNHHDLLHPR